MRTTASIATFICNIVIIIIITTVIIIIISIIAATRARPVARVALAKPFASKPQMPGL